MISFQIILYILYGVIGLIMLLSLIKGLIQGFKKNVYVLIKTILFWVIFFVTCDLLSTPINTALLSESLFSSFNLSSDANFLEYLKGLICNLVNIDPSVLSSTAVNDSIVAIIHMVLKLVYLLLLAIFYNIIMAIIYGIFFKKFSVTSKKKLKALQRREMNRYNQGRPMDKKLRKNIVRLEKNIKLKKIDKPLGLLTGIVNGALTVIILFCLVNSFVFTLPELPTSEQYATASEEEILDDTGLTLYSYVNDNYSSYVSILDYIAEYQQSSITKITSFEINGKRLDKIFMDKILSGKSNDVTIELRDEIETIVKIAGYACILTKGFDFENINWLSLDAKQAAYIKKIILTLADEDFITNLIPAAVSYAMTLDQVKAYLPDNLDPSTYNNINWSEDLKTIANLVEDVYSLGDLSSLDYLNLDADKVEKIVTGVANLQCVQFALNIGGYYVVNNFLTEKDESGNVKNQEQIDKIIDDLADVLWKEDITSLSKVYKKFIDLSIQDIMEESKGEDEQVNYLYVATKADSSKLQEIVDIVFETSFLENVLPDVLDIVKEKYVPAEYASLINPNVVTAENWKEELDVVFDILKKLTNNNEDPITTIESFEFSRLSKISTETILQSDLLSHAMISILCDGSKGEGVASMLSDYVRIPDDLTKYDETNKKYPDAWYGEDGELYIMLDTIKKAAEKVTSVSNIMNDIVPIVQTIDADKVSQSTVLQYSISNLLVKYAGDYLKIPVEGLDSTTPIVTVNEQEMKLISSAEIKSILAAITDKDIFDLESLLVYTVVRDDVETVVTKDEIEEGESYTTKLDISDTNKLIDLLTSKSLYNYDDPDPEEKNLNKLFDSVILRASITNIIQTYAGSVLTIPDSGSAIESLQVYDADDNLQDYTSLSKTELKNLIKTICKLDLDLTALQDDPLSIISSFEKEVEGVKQFDEDKVDSIFDDSDSNKDYSEVLHATLSNKLTDPSLISGFTILIPTEVKTSKDYIQSSEITNLFKALYNLDIKALSEASGTDAILDTIMGCDDIDSTFDSVVLRTTITNFLVTSSFSITIPNDDKVFDTETYTVTYSEDSSNTAYNYNDEVMKKSELTNIILGFKALKNEVGSEKSYSDLLSLDGITVGKIYNVKDELLASYIINATISEKIVDIATDPTASFSIIIDSELYDNTYIDEDELPEVFNALYIICGDTSINELSSIDTDSILDKANIKDAFESSIIRCTVSKVIGDISEIVIPVEEGVTTNKILRLNKTDESGDNYIDCVTKVELDNLIDAYTALKEKVNEGKADDELLSGTDIFDMDNLTTATLADDTVSTSLINSSITYATFSNKIVNIATDTDSSFDLIIPSSIYDGTYYIDKTNNGQELKNLLTALNIITDGGGISSLNSFDANSILDKSGIKTAFNSVIIQGTISKVLVGIGDVTIPTVDKDDNDVVTETESLKKGSGTQQINFISKTELDNLIDAYSALKEKVNEGKDKSKWVSGTDIFNMNNLTIATLADDTVIDGLITSSITYATFSNKIIETAKDNTSGFDLIVKYNLYDNVYYIDKENDGDELKNLLSALNIIAGSSKINDLSSIETSSMLDNDNITDTFNSIIIRGTISNYIGDMSGVYIPTSDSSVMERDTQVIQKEGVSGNKVVDFVKEDELDNLVEGYKALRDKVNDGKTDDDKKYGADILNVSNINLSDVTDDSVLNKLTNSKIIRCTLSKNIINKTTGTSPTLYVGVNASYEDINGNELYDGENYILESELKLFFKSISVLSSGNISSMSVDSTLITGIIANDTQFNTLFASEIMVNTLSVKIYDLFDSNSELEFLDYSTNPTYGFTSRTITREEEKHLFKAINVFGASDLGSINITYNDITSMSESQYQTICLSNLISYNAYLKLDDQNQNTNTLGNILILEQTGYTRNWYYNGNWNTDNLYTLLLAISDSTMKGLIEGGDVDVSDFGTFKDEAFIKNLTGDEILCDSIPNIISKFTSNLDTRLQAYYSEPSRGLYIPDKLNELQFRDESDSNIVSHDKWKTYWQGEENDCSDGEFYKLFDGIENANAVITEVENYSALSSAEKLAQFETTKASIQNKVAKAQESDIINQSFDFSSILAIFSV